MLTVDAAQQAILSVVEPFAPTLIPLDDSLGLVLAADITSDVDSPPFDKSLMDGFAVRSRDVTGGESTLRLIEEVAAGRTPTQTVGPGQATQIMTGAPLPAGADAVVPVEQSQTDVGTGEVRLTTDAILPGANVLRQGTSMRSGDRVLPAGRLLRPQDLGLLAELGHATVSSRRRPRVAVLATGDELVTVDQTPGPGQIRNSNETMLLAQIRRAGAEPVPLGIARDEPKHLSTRIRAGLDCDMLLLSGGVSAGKFDLVPAQLQAAGVRQVFHKVQLKPGKPIWFGVQEQFGASPAGTESRSPCLVFGLPGNPVSSLVCFELFVRTAIRRQMGAEPALPEPVSARLSQEHLARGNRPTYHPVRLDWTASGPVVTPVRWQGSADLRGTADANAMTLFPAGNMEFQPNDAVDTFPW